VGQNIVVDRYLTKQIQHDIQKKMVFLGGARQVGKTTLARSLLEDQHTGYLNWDIPDHKDAIAKRDLPLSPLWVFDELHKYRLWRNYLKGVFDQVGATQRILVTGSARLDLYRHGGDSLQGRYHYLRLHPLSVAELATSSRTDMEQLFQLGGFPEPFLSGSEVEARRWSKEYHARFVREEVTSVESVVDVGRLELLLLRLPQLVGSPLSINSLREDLQLNHSTVARWLTIAEHLYGIFRIPPYGPPKLRAVKKGQKHYHFDWSVVVAPATRFENFVASHLIKWVNYREDALGFSSELRFFRDTTGREVDFVILEGGKPTTLIECKFSDHSVSPHLKYLHARIPGVRAVQVVWFPTGSQVKEYKTKEGIEVLSAERFLGELV
jgi:uncharacterized protein